MTPQRYSGAAIVLHWLIAALLAFQIALGWQLEGPKTAELFARFQLHKSIGISILLLTLIRIAIRFTVPRPAPSEGPRWATTLAGAVHFAFYAVLILGPLSGWLMVSSARTKVPTLLFGVVPWPHLPIPESGRHAAHEVADALHGPIAWIALALIALHVAGALRHQWLLGKPELQRMIPGARGRAIPAAIGAIALIIGAMVIGRTILPNRVAAAPEPAPSAAPLPDASPAPEATPAPAPEPSPTATQSPAATAAADWTIARGGRLGFTAKWNGDAIRGSFARWTGTIAFDPQALDRARIRISVDLASVATGDGQRDTALGGDDFFATAAHPKAVFSATRVRQTAPGRYEAAGTLDLKGISRPATVRFALAINGDKATVSGSASVDRTGFKVGEGEWAATDALAAPVAIDFAFSATRG